MSSSQLDRFVQLSQAELAAVFGVSTRTIQRWAQEDPPLTRNPDATYSLPAAVAWALVRERRLALPGGDDMDALLRADVRKAETLASLRELELAERQGELVAIDFLEEQLSRSLSAVAGELRRAPHELASRLARARLLISRGEQRVRRQIDDYIESVLLIALQTAGDDLDDADVLDASATDVST